VDRITVTSPAKINLGLEILKKRRDGYHDIKTIFQKISLFDEITLRLSSQRGITISADDPSIPEDSTNLAYRAAALLLHDQNLVSGVSIHIKKNIPAGAGLGGGSSNAASTLLGLNRLMGLQLPADYLQRICLSLGADVPFFISGHGTAAATGIGEILIPLSLTQKLWLVIVFPGFSVSTAWAYAAYGKFNSLTKKKKINIIKNYILDMQSVKSLLFNDFEAIVIREYPEIKKIKDTLTKAGAVETLLCGSGSSVFGLFACQRDSKKAFAMLPTQARHKTFIAHSL